ncbi:LLM class F420-dependent oxidoreductase [Mycobacterium intermedium]|uniref:LLM class F420-dependent oxidoreductase n=1 Tax=Mycobacterium intermedium TaxID=28445 RepID=A0A1E3SLL5_MYCIE|nr:LLM class F420-dependent oxidoreductase [Mycobacterium intermedium]MCV6964792.1 LLM class F420-dependent oxidoreductase [Mycobacterium intermedium]ODR03040.1 LLM class F420-dependent oxidoreductase [Mycobacterium intermedium]OPE48356.1 LLM class F420-dependent oxidoreductase [Mycobacterium intermedium]ORB02385.1 LLM class F420-dependent oxidoreductase [Mycobacterium intermedium]
MGSAARLKVDGGIPNQLAKAADAARNLEQRGYDGGWTAETSHDPFLPLLLAAEHTSRIELGTNIAVAFARNPMIVANLGWDLQAYSEGRFILGLGTQIQPHIEKRFSMPWSHPARRMREFVAALHAIWSAWRDGGKLQFEGEFYTHKIMTPMFTPEPQPYPPPKIFLAAVGEAMTELCGEVADGHLGHPMVSKRFLTEVTLPVLRRGLERAGRDRSEFEVSAEVMVATGENDDELAKAMAAARKQIAFYGSTPAYRKVLEVHGWGDLQPELHRLSKQGEWDTMASLLDDEMLRTFAVVGPVEEIGAALRERCEGVVDRALPIFFAASQNCISAALKEFHQ